MRATARKRPAADDRLSFERVITRRMTARGIMQKDLMPGYSPLVPPVIDLCVPRVRPLHSRSVIFSVSPPSCRYVARSGIVDMGREFFTAAPQPLCRQSRRLVTRLGVIKNARRSSEARARTFIIVRVVLRAPNETSARSYFILATLYNSDNYYMTSVSMNSGGRARGGGDSVSKRESIARKEK